MSKLVSIGDFLNMMGLGQYTQKFTDFGIATVQDITFLTPEDWQSLSILPFHRTKIIHGAATISLDKSGTMFYPFASTCNNNELHNWEFQSNGPYNGSHKPENLKNFEPEGYGLASMNPSYMSFTFKTPQSVYGMVIGNNVGVSGGWGSSYLEGVNVFVKKSGCNDFEKVHTISGMPNAANTAYLAKIDKQNVVEVRLEKASYFSTSFIHFV